ncbi:unnamed protein product [Notodromas monacha]|uniref:F-box domain-containing protein n=1 Tax=Notodromas monacha TaxID=399045 RepID=A0A7R9GEH4_9CRUS|nr:unnamed protein product [Notodromas monacha]CAG0919734.1 unnamed protein product [Notodromas monacha]
MLICQTSRTESHQAVSPCSSLRPPSDPRANKTRGIHVGSHRHVGLAGCAIAARWSKLCLGSMPCLLHRLVVTPRKKGFDAPVPERIFSQVQQGYSAGQFEVNVDIPKNVATDVHLGEKYDFLVVDQGHVVENRSTHAQGFKVCKNSPSPSKLPTHRIQLHGQLIEIETVTLFDETFDDTRSELFVPFSAMRAFLLKLNFGLRDLSYMELERHDATHPGPRCGTNPSQKTVSCYFERFGNECITEGTQFRLHVHKEEKGVKVGEVCPKQSRLESIFSIFQCPSGDFILSGVGKKNQRFGFFLFVNNDVLPFDEEGMRVLRHGDIIKGLFCKIPTFRIMFLLSDSSHVRETQTSLLLSSPWLVLKNIAKFLPPFEMMRDVVPVCRQFFHLMRDGSSWTRVEFCLKDGMQCPPFGHFQDFCNVVYKHVRKLSLKFNFDPELEPLWPRNILRPIFQHHDWSKLKVLEVDNLDTNEEAWSEFLRRSGKKLIHLEMLSVLEDITLADLLLEASKAGHVLFPNCREVRLRLKKLHLNHAILHDTERLRSNLVLLRDPHLRQFPDFLGSGVLSSLHTYQLPVKLDAGGWKLARKMGIFANLESLSMSGEIFNNMPPAKKKIIYFPKLKSLWLEDASPIAACRHFPLMPSLEHLWIRNAVREETSIKPTQEVLQALQVFNSSPIEWLENLKCVSADVWETYIPYSNMINLECVALFFQHKTVEKSPGGVFKELRSCSKLRGLILKVPDNLPLETIGQLSQPLEFIAFPGTKLNKAWSVLRQLSHCKDSLEDLWIEVCNFKEGKKILRAVKAFKRLKNIVLFSKTDEESGEGLPETMLGCLGPVSSLYQATFVCEFGPDLGHKYITCDVKQQTSSEFSSRFVTRFYSEWLRLVPNQLVQGKLSVFEAISAIFNPRLDRPTMQPRRAVLLLDFDS